MKTTNSQRIYSLHESIKKNRYNSMYSFRRSYESIEIMKTDLQTLKDLGGPISYCYIQKMYYYKKPFDLKLI
jgi:hypothetical protein